MSKANCHNSQLAAYMQRTFIMIIHKLSTLIVYLIVQLFSLSELIVQLLRKEKDKNEKEKSVYHLLLGINKYQILCVKSNELMHDNKIEPRDT